MADGFTLDEIRDLFRDDVHRLLRDMRQALERLHRSSEKRETLQRLRDAGHALKGSAGLVGLTYLSQAGAGIESLASFALQEKEKDTGFLSELRSELAAALPYIEQMLNDALQGANPEIQENLFTAFTLCFSESLRVLLHGHDSQRQPQARRAAGGDSGSVSRGGDEEWLAELEQAFQEELRENLQRVPALLAQLADAAQRQRAYYDLSRVFHTIKGSAAMVGRQDLSDLARYLQDTLGEAAETGSLPDEAVPVVQSTIRAIFTSAQLAPPDAELAQFESPQVPREAAIPAAPEIDPELLEAFALDADEALEASERLLLQLERQPSDRGILQALFRRFHTLKGAAAAVGLDHIAVQVHQGESLLEAVLNGALRVDNTRLVDVLFRLTDAVKLAAQSARGAALPTRPPADLGAEIAALMEHGVAESEATPPAEAPTEPYPATAAEAGPEADWESGMVRIHASRLDTLMNQVTQLVVSRTRMERKIEAFAELRDKLDYCRRRLADLIQGFQEHYEYTIGDRRAQATLHAATPADEARPDDFFTDLEFDKYDDVNILARSVIELATDTGEIAEQLGSLIESFGDDSRQFSKITSSLQRQITRLRMVPLDTVFRRLVRPVRNAARQAEKIVDLVFEGGDVQLDKGIVEALHAPLLHLVRNAVSHGIEPPAERQARGKSTAGTIRITAQPRHNTVAIEVSDDGRGINYDAILAKGRSLGMIPPGVWPTREQLLSLIFQPGFSTGEEVTDLAGRGVGMDVVARDIAALNGSLQVESRDYEGTTIRLLLPISTSIDEVLLLHVGEQTYAIGADYVEQAVAVRPEEIVTVDGQAMLQVRNELVPMLFLGALVGQPVVAESSMGLLLRSADQLMALVVDRVEPQREAVLQPLGPLLEHHPFLSSATISGDGTVIFTLHVGHLFDLLHQRGAHPSTFILEAKAQDTVRQPEAILVVDDSISVRKMASRFLQSEGWEVDTAVDGLDALDKLASGRFRLIITDLEMPRMHGYELIAEVRRQPALQHLPIIVCSSRSSDKHRTRAAEVGAQGYLTKPFTKEQLIEEMVRVAGREILPAHFAGES